MRQWGGNRQVVCFLRRVPNFIQLFIMNKNNCHLVPFSCADAAILGSNATTIYIVKILIEILYKACNRIIHYQFIHFF
jgi:hypothetical protein